MYAMNSIKKITIYHLVLLAIVLRCFFMWVVAPLYFGRANVHMDNDTMAWMYSFINFWEHGQYTTVLTDPNGVFMRAPFYSFFLGFFYLINGKQLIPTFQLAAYTQILLEGVAVWLVYKLVLKSSAKELLALFSAFLYSCYPFIIVWVPVAYSEQMSVLLLLLGLYWTLNKQWYWPAGIAFAMGAMCRFQVALIIPAIILVDFFTKEITWKIKMKRAFLIGATFILCYGGWPARNYFLHHRLVIFQDGYSEHFDACYTKDVYSFWRLMLSVQTEIEPQFTQIIHNDSIIPFPSIVYTCAEDSVLLNKGVRLLKNCSSGISYFQGYWKTPLVGTNCNQEISVIFDTLTSHQIHQHPWRVYLWVPILNLKKSFFKLTLINKTGWVKYVGMLLFSFRTLLLLCGIIGLFLMSKEKSAFIHLNRIVIAFFVFWYLVMAFYYKDIEIRYYLQNDVLMLIPAAILGVFILNKFKQKQSEKN